MAFSIGLMRRDELMRPLLTLPTDEPTKRSRFGLTGLFGALLLLALISLALMFVNMRCACLGEGGLKKDLFTVQEANSADEKERSMWSLPKGIFGISKTDEEADRAGVGRIVEEAMKVENEEEPNSPPIAKADEREANEDEPNDEREVNKDDGQTDDDEKLANLPAPKIDELNDEETRVNDPPTNSDENDSNDKSEVKSDVEVKEALSAPKIGESESKMKDEEKRPNSPSKSDETMPEVKADDADEKMEKLSAPKIDENESKMKNDEKRPNSPSKSDENAPQAKNDDQEPNLSVENTQKAESEIAGTKQNSGAKNDETPTAYDEIQKANSLPTILYWTPFFHGATLREYIRHFDECPHECRYTDDREQVRDAEAVVFHARHTNVGDLPTPNRDQLRIFFNMEPPAMTFFESKERTLADDDFFNLTMTYRSSSPLFHPYGELRPLDGSEKSSERWNQSEIDALIERKDKVAYYAISHCETPSKRESYLERLSAHMNITKLGRCAKRCRDAKCRKELTGNPGRMRSKWGYERFLRQQSQEHFFVFAFENSVCPEYVTEKFFRLFELVVPVVLTRASMPDFVPQSAYVAASDFETPQALAEYLERVAANRTEYRKFFEWTRHYRRTPFEFIHPDHECKICELLHTRKYEDQSVTSDYRKHMDASVCSKDFGRKLADGNLGWIRSEEERLRRNVQSAESDAHLVKRREER